MTVSAINVSPTSGATIARLDPISFRLQHDDIARAIVAVRYPDGRREVVFSGGAFAPIFAFASTSSFVGDGIGTDFVVRRTGGWDAPPTVEATEADEQPPGWGYPWGAA